MHYLRFSAGSLIGLLLFVFTIGAQTAAPPVRFQPYLSGLSAPVFITNAKDGSKRMFVVERGGVIKVIQPGSNAPTVFMNIASKIVAGGEQGLLGLTFHPQFATNHYFFVNYTRISDGATVIARYTATNNNSVGDPNSERIVLTIDQPFSNHNGGMIEFGPDGNLYIGMGDGGSGNDPGNRAQNINELLGKFLRITPDVSGNNANAPYTVPADNPFVGVNGADEIYTVGMRNPWRWSFDRGGTRQLWAADVGQGAIEEVDIITRGANYGWRVYEGNQCTNLDPAQCNPANYTPPIFQYAHTGGRCSITGGYVYRGTQGNLPNGAYIYADYCTGEVWIWQNNQQILLQDTTRLVVSFGEDEDGELYMIGIGNTATNGTVEKIVRPRANADFDGDAKTDISVFRPSNGAWYILNSSNGAFRGQIFGQNGDVPVPADYDGDNISDIAVFRNGFWYYIRSSNGTVGGVQFGQAADAPTQGDYDGDGKADVSVLRYGTGGAFNNFYVLNSGSGATTSTFISQCCHIAVQGDYDGDGKTDVATWKSQTNVGYWTIINSSNGTTTSIPFGNFADNPANSDIPAQGDYDGDGKDDIAVFRPSTGTWYIRQSSTAAVQGVQFGASGDVPTVGDYDGDGKADIAIFRPSSGQWYYLRSSNGTVGGVQFGQNGDLPIPAYTHNTLRP